MTVAFVFLNCDIGTGSAVIEEIRRISGVTEASGVSGIYDIAAKLHSDSNKGVAGIVSKFYAITRVRSCSTMIVTAGGEEEEVLGNGQSK